jgi:hypothetical protein
MRRWCTTHSVKWRLYDRHQDRSCERRKSRAAARSQAGAPLSWTNERADTLFVCEGVRKAAAHERQPQRAERAMHEGGSGGVLSSASDDDGGGSRCSRRRSAGGDGGTTLFRSVGSDEDGGNPANIAASGASNRKQRDARAAQKGAFRSGVTRRSRGCPDRRGHRAQH